MANKHYIYVEVPEAVKKKAKTLAKKADLSLRQWITKLLKEAK
jgi:predicted HicB family RNase H-like nuclease